MDLFEDTPDTGPGNAPEFSVSEISGAVKRTIEGEFSHVRVRGEVGRVSRPSSGHLYLDLKDDRAVLASVIWKGQAAKLTHRPEEGMEVIATGRLTTFPGQSRYQMVIEDIQPAGAGALMAMLEKRRKALAAEGLFDADRKRPLPFLPEVIGVVTSPSGAVIRDILHRLRDRFPRKVLVWPVAVQGAKCAAEVANAIKGFNAMTPGGALPRPDLIIVARGGGSIEDLWGFNEEIVVRAAAASAIPLISAVGHETDTTLIDYASDQRAPTPTAAAELAVPVRLELLATTDSLGARLHRGLEQGVRQRRQRLSDLSRALPQPDGLLAPARQRLDFLGEQLKSALREATAKKALRLADLSLRPGALRRSVADERRRADSLAARLTPALTRTLRDRSETFTQRASRLQPALVLTRIERQRDRLISLDRLRSTLGYKATLARGYAIVRGDGQVVTDKVAAGAAQSLEIEFKDGRLSLGPKSPKKPKTPPPEQGTLL
ncbi:exodeoxyribonuclease VII large subunit [Flavimaricola marinus]|uniref:Exodeoxyribonuclease 7 large subunit n=1 Tax=Flavimaricola marinus TaxID=1819565 RepID=A0A238LH07_9RHOB|nr:exodeoxyribonuclease VII large subunit [Flavimaricola marinus]SMY08684.1 Exodeoxyribonuclease 7 large subunit [Flavimaricola marinus]